MFTLFAAAALLKPAYGYTPPAYPATVFLLGLVLSPAVVLAILASNRLGRCLEASDRVRAVRVVLCLFGLGVLVGAAFWSVCTPGRDAAIAAMPLAFGPVFGVGLAAGPEQGRRFGLGLAAVPVLWITPIVCRLVFFL